MKPQQVPAGTLLDDKYRVVRLLGRGAMGAVYEVENVKVRRSAALKLLPTTASSEIVRRFEAEAQAAGRAGSKRIVDVLDLGRTREGQAYMVMELLEGETLRDEAKRVRRLTPKRAATLLVDVLTGLEAAHRAGIVHRDLKPENIWVLAQPADPRATTGDTPIVKILDFGVSRFTVGDDEGGAPRPQTAEGTMIGTCWYMSPEQIRDARTADARSDVYAVGVMLYELLSGNVPFPGGTMPELIYKILHEPADDPRAAMPELPERLTEVALRALSKKPDDRYPSATDMREHLAAFLEERPPLHLDLGLLDVRPSGASPSPPPPPPSLDIALDMPATSPRPSTLETWRATLDSPAPHNGPYAPTLAEAAPTPAPVTVTHAGARATLDPGAPTASARGSEVGVAAPPPSSPRLQPPPDLVPPSSRAPGSAPRGPISLELAAAPRRAVPFHIPPGWPLAPVLVGAISLAVIALSTIVGVLFRAGVLG